MRERSLVRAIKRTRHEQRACIALAAEVMVSAPYADPERPRTGEVPGYMTRAAELTAEIDTRLDQLHELHKAKAEAHR